MVNLWVYWEAHDPDSNESVDHAAWGEILDKYLIVREKGANLFDYAAVSDEDRARLQDYLDHLTGLTITDYNRDQQFVYWVNLYNALTVELILDHWPVDSITEITAAETFLGRLFANGPWDAELVEIEGKNVSLNDIEHRILRPIWQDERIHYVVNCASIGCPDLNPEPYSVDKLDRQLNEAARAFINDPRAAKVEDGRLTASKIYSWYKEDFGSSDRDVIAELKKYARPELKESLEGIHRISGHRYDWSINAPSGERGSGA